MCIYIYLFIYLFIYIHTYFFAGKGILRTGVEEFMLASEYAPHDELAAEFIRTFKQSFFFGKAYLDRLEQLMRAESIQIDKCIPKKSATAEIFDQVRDGPFQRKAGVQKDHKNHLKSLKET